MKAMDKRSRILNICLHTHLFTVDFRGFMGLTKILLLRVDQNHSWCFQNTDASASHTPDLLSWVKTGSIMVGMVDS